jgi:hypothetical protein
MNDPLKDMPRRTGECLWALQASWDDEGAATWARATIARIRAETRAAQSRTGLAGPHDHWICAAAAFALGLIMVSV